MEKQMTEVYREVLEEMLEDVRIYEDYDVLGHLDYMIRYGKDKEQAYSYLKYAELIDEILKNIIAKGKGLELNMAGSKIWTSICTPTPGCIKKIPGVRWRDHHSRCRRTLSGAYCIGL